MKDGKDWINKFYYFYWAIMESILNKLIEMGWKPFGITCTDFIKGTWLEWIPSYCFNPHPHMWFAWWTRKYHRPSLRQIVSKESWLWQFVCQNDMVDKKKIWIYYEMFLEENWIDAKNYRPFSLVERLIMESSLKDESELEDFFKYIIKI